MKKYFIIIAIILFISCDKEMDYDYFIVNNCSESINIYIEVGHNNESASFVIAPLENQFVYHGTSINSLQDRLVEYFFKKVIIKKDSKTSIVNYIDKNKWKFEPTSNSHANSYLIVNPEDFEN